MLPPKLTGKMDDGEIYKNILAQVIKRDKFVCGATVISKTSAVAPIEPHFQEYMFDQMKKKKRKNCFDIKLSIGINFCDVKCIYPESNFQPRSIDPELVLIFVSFTQHSRLQTSQLYCILY